MLVNVGKYTGPMDPMGYTSFLQHVPFSPRNAGSKRNASMLAIMLSYCWHHWFVVFHCHIRIYHEILEFPINPFDETNQSTLEIQNVFFHHLPPVAESILMEYVQKSSKGGAICTWSKKEL